MSNLTARRTRIETLTTLIRDAESRIERHKTDIDGIEYVNEQKQCIEDWMSELTYLEQQADIIGYFVHTASSNLVFCCEDCTTNLTSGNDPTLAQPTKVYDVNVHPYTQICHNCKVVVYKGGWDTILFDPK